jgi:hypothetical protein
MDETSSATDGRKFKKIFGFPIAAALELESRIFASLRGERNVCDIFNFNTGMDRQDIYAAFDDLSQVKIRLYISPDTIGRRDLYDC